MLKYLLGTDSGIQGDELGASDEVKPEEVEWQTAAIEGKLDLLVTLDFRMSSTCLFSDIVLPTATGMKRRYEHLGHAPVYPPALRRRRPGPGGEKRLGDLQGYR